MEVSGNISIIPVKLNPIQAGGGGLQRLPLLHFCVYVLH